MFRGFREFGEFLRGGEGISTNILSDRLRRLTSVGLVLQSDHPSDGKKFVYRLTEKGVDLAAVLIELTLWGAKHFPDHVAPPDILAMMRMDPERLISELRTRLLAEGVPTVHAGKVQKDARPPAHTGRGSRADRRSISKRSRKARKPSSTC